MQLATKFSWKSAPDLMARLNAAQNALLAPIDIVSFAGYCDSRDELLRHVEHYEARVAKQRVWDAKMAAAEQIKFGVRL
jgi:hypothetical protein